MQPCRLDQQLGEDQQHTLADLLVAPPLVLPSPSSSACPSNDKRAQVEALLSHLSLREQQVVRLHYGLDEQDGQERSQVAVAALLGIAQAQVNRIERGALAKLRALGMQAASAQDDGERLVKSQQRQTLLERLAQEVQAQGGSEEERLARAYERLTTEGVGRLNHYVLCKVARVEGHLALAFWRERRGGSQEERIAAAYAQLEAQGLRPTNKRIVQLTQVDVKAIAAYRRAGCPTLEQCRQAANNKPPRVARETPQERLDRALAQLEAQGEQVTKARLEQLARVASKTAGAYLRAYRAGMLTSVPEPERKTHEDDPADSGMQTAQVPEIGTAVYQERLDGIRPSWYTCSSKEKGTAT